jgi:hypothetical protein
MDGKNLTLQGIRPVAKRIMNGILEEFISGSISSKLSKKSILDSNAVLPI